MKTKKVIALIISFILIVLGSMIVGLSLYSADFDFSKLNSLNVVENTYTIKEDFTSISAKSLECDIRLSLSENDECKVICREYTKVAHKAAVEDNTLTITREDSRKWYDYIGVFIDKTEIIVFLPKAEYEALNIGGATGDIDVPDDFKFKNITLSTNTGDIYLASKVKEDLSITTSTGDVEILNTNPKNVSIASDTGDIELTCTIASENITISTDTGDIELSECDAKNLLLSSDTGDISGTLLSGKIFKAESNTGDITVPLSTSGGACEIKTDTGDIYIKSNK